MIAVSLRRSLLETDEVLRDTAAQLEPRRRCASFASPASPPPDGTLQRMTEAAAAVLQRLKQTERDALRAEQLAWVGQMAAGIAHEVRNPLMAIKLLVQAATDPRRRPASGPATSRSWRTRSSGSNRSSARSSTSPARRGRTRSRSRSPELLTECLAGVRAAAELQGVEVRLDVAEPAPVVDADPDQSGRSSTT